MSENPNVGFHKVHEAELDAIEQRRANGTAVDRESCSKKWAKAWTAARDTVLPQVEQVIAPRSRRWLRLILDVVKELFLSLWHAPANIAAWFRGKTETPTPSDQVMAVVDRFVKEFALRTAALPRLTIASGAFEAAHLPLQFVTILRTTLGREIELALSRRRGLSGAIKALLSADVIKEKGGTPGERAFRRAEKQVMDEIYAHFARQDALNMNLVGLAFSGGGIRSATFNLGMLQGLAELELLGQFDYLSTVSGGGYIGGWLGAWIKRAGSLDAVQEQLKPKRGDNARQRTEPPLLPSDEEPEPIYHLRAYSSYLTPRTGLFSADTWTLLAIYFRNLLLNLLVLVPFTVGVLLAPRFLIRYYNWYNPDWDLWAIASIVGALPLVLGLMAVSVRASGVSLQKRAWMLHGFILVPLLVIALLLTWLWSYDFRYNYPLWAPKWAEQLEAIVPFDLESLRDNDTNPYYYRHLKLRCLDAKARPAFVTSTVAFLGSAVPMGGLISAGSLPIIPRGTGHHMAWMLLIGTGAAAILFVVFLFFGAWFKWYRPWWKYVLNLAFAAITGFIGAAIYYLVFAVFMDRYYPEEWSVAAIATCGPSAALAVMGLSIYFAIGLLGRGMTEGGRELWGSFCGWLFLYASGWALIIGLALFGPVLVYSLNGWWQAVIGSTWLGAAFAGIRAAGSAKTDGRNGNRLLEILARTAPAVVLIAFVLLLSLVAAALADNVPDPADLNTYFTRMNSMLCTPIAIWMTVLIGASMLLALRVDINLFSMHATYGNRLVRCYLGASRPKDRGFDIRDRLGGTPVPTSGERRQPNAITGFDSADDLPLRKLRIEPEQTANNQAEKPYRGPQLIINTALNLLAGDELAWQERRAASFVLTPEYCGSKSTGFRRLTDDEVKTLTLGTAITLSGAAVSPNMGYHSSPPVTALLTVVNARLGGWVQNPRAGALRNQGPGLGLLHLFKEMFGRTNARSWHVYLSDGGHFENLGVYELVRRRCKYIVACDAGADPNGTFDDLGNLIRKCRTDFGIRIRIDASPLRRKPGESFSRWHCAIGEIRYQDVDPEAAAGVLVYIKSSLTGDEPSDILQFHGQHPEFPHHPTSDQFFNESKFESYRALGMHVARSVFREAITTYHDRSKDAAPATDFTTAALFERLQNRWYPPPANADENFLRSTKAFVDLHEILRSDKNLHGLSHEIYSPLDPKVAGETKHTRIPELHAVTRMLQVMEDTWVTLKLDEHRQYPLYQGWFEVFQRWTASKTFRELWQVLRREYSDDFQRFCDKLMAQGAPAGNGDVKPTEASP